MWGAMSKPPHQELENFKTGCLAAKEVNGRWMRWTPAEAAGDDTAGGAGHGAVASSGGGGGAASTAAPSQGSWPPMFAVGLYSASWWSANHH